jgi:hypothetical protein
MRSPPICFLFVSILSIFLAESTKANPPFLGFRGGAAFAPNEKVPSVLSAVGILVAGNGTEHHHADIPWVAGGDDASSCIMFDSHQNAVSRASNLPWDDGMTRVFAMLCDVVVLVLPDNNQIDAGLLSSLVDGAKKRVGTSLGKGRLILVTPFEEENDSLRMEDLVRRQFADILPSEWDSFEIIPKPMLEEHLREMFLEQKGNVRGIFSGEEGRFLFVKVLHQVYQMECNKSIPPFEVDMLAGVPPASSTKKKESDTGDEDAQMQEILINCRVQLESLESKLQDVLLSDNHKQMPLLEFGAMADRLLNQTFAELADFPSGIRLGILTPVVTELHRLYMEQLQTLRDYYGKRYEHILDESNDEGKWTSAAERFIQGFQAASTNSVPVLCQPNGALAEIAPFLATDSLQGLITDMLEATQIRKDEHSLAMEGEDEYEELGRFHRVPRWLKKFAGRALVLGVNYIQGWLAWQGVRRAASERDRSMPKFPLF